MELNETGEIKKIEHNYKHFNYILLQVIQGNTDLKNIIYQNIQKIQNYIENVSNLINKEIIDDKKIEVILRHEVEIILVNTIKETSVIVDKIHSEINNLKKEICSQENEFLFNCNQRVKDILHPNFIFLTDKVIQENGNMKINIFTNLEKVQGYIININKIISANIYVSKDQLKNFLIDTYKFLNQIIVENNHSRDIIFQDIEKIKINIQNINELVIHSEQPVIKNDKTEKVIKELLSKVSEIIESNRDSENNDIKEYINSNFETIFKDNNLIINRINDSNNSIIYEIIDKNKNLLKGQENICELVIESENKASLILKDLKILIDSSNNIIDLISQSETQNNILFKNLSNEINVSENKITYLINKSDIKNETLLKDLNSIVNNSEKKLSGLIEKSETQQSLLKDLNSIIDKSDNKQEVLLHNLLDNNNKLDIENKNIFKSLETNLNNSEHKICCLINKLGESNFQNCNTILNEISNLSETIYKSDKESQEKNNLIIKEISSLIKNSEQKIFEIVNKKDKEVSLGVQIALKELNNVIEIVNNSEQSNNEGINQNLIEINNFISLINQSEKKLSLEIEVIFREFNKIINEVNNLSNNFSGKGVIIFKDLLQAINNNEKNIVKNINKIGNKKKLSNNKKKK